MIVAHTHMRARACRYDMCAAHKGMALPKSPKARRVNSKLKKIMSPESANNDVEMANK